MRYGKQAGVEFRKWPRQIEAAWEGEGRATYTSHTASLIEAANSPELQQTQDQSSVTCTSVCQCATYCYGDSSGAGIKGIAHGGEH